ncbi:beta-1,3-galactosyltransferase 4 [Denticeps clupeoides]|uniref:Hexosyltransferase n=1 Tax=Denticeps clupeoides TaxID=299321 RepID=A0AAY4DC97_9TELE|nr:beta-1,3-galactosyltransferase 4 [Denticeps clupeoides]
MVVRGLWGCRSRLGKLRLRHVLCLAAAACALLALLFVDLIELWVTSLGMSGPVEGPVRGGGPRAQSVPPMRPEEYLLMPSPLVCQRARPYLLAMVSTAPANQWARQAIRDTWGGEVEVSRRRVLTLFTVGVPTDPGLAKLLVVEAREHGDLVQGRFQDNYANLTLKTLSMLAWAKRFCPQTQYLAKVDDDVLFNPSGLLRYLDHSHDSAGHTDLYLGRVHLGVAPNRNPSSKHFLSAQAYNANVFPDYCSGTTYVLSRTALLKLSLTAAAMPLARPLPPEDVFVGLCARAAGVAPTHCPLFSGGLAVPYGRCCYQAMVSVHQVTPAQMRRFWADAHASEACSWLRLRASLGLCKVRALLGTLVGQGDPQ